MAKIIFATILITLVYSWEEIKFALFQIFSRNPKSKIFLDKFVADAVLLSTIPLTVAL